MTDKKETVLQKCRNAIDHGEPITDYSFYYDVVSILEEQEKYISRISTEYLKLVNKTSKMPRIVRCKDCRFKGQTGSPFWDYWCARQGRNVDRNWFCGDGE